MSDQKATAVLAVLATAAACYFAAKQGDVSNSRAELIASYAQVDELRRQLSQAQDARTVLLSKLEVAQEAGAKLLVQTEQHQQHLCQDRLNAVQLKHEADQRALQQMCDERWAREKSECEQKVVHERNEADRLRQEQQELHRDAQSIVAQMEDQQQQIVLHRRDTEIAAAQCSSITRPEATTSTAVNLNETVPAVLVSEYMALSPRLPHQVDGVSKCV